MSVPIYVLGGSQTDFARNWAREGLSIYDMFRETLDQALHSTGINPDQIEVGHVGNFGGDLFTGQGLSVIHIIRCRLFTMSRSRGAA